MGLSDRTDRALLVASLTEAPSPDGREIVALAGQADWLEVRADRVGDLDAAWLRDRFPGKLLFTLRSRGEGGAGDASPERRRPRLAAAAAAGYDYVDLEAERDDGTELLAAIPAARRIVSWHGGSADLDALRARLARLEAVEAACYKLVPRAVHSGEELPPLELGADLRRRDLVAFASGETGAWTRLVAPRFGAPLVFGAASETPAAPGQIPIRRLRADYGLPALRPLERLFGVVGFPALASLSPRLHNAAYDALGIAALFVPFETESFGDFWLELVEGPTLDAIALPLGGLAVTAPHKELALAVSGASSPLAQRLQSANTLVRTQGVWEAESTDAAGLLGALAARGIAAAGRRAVVVGSGGAGRAAALGLDRAGARVVLANRGVERGMSAARTLGLPFVPLAEIVASRFDLVVNATPVGRRADDPPPVPAAELAPGTVAVDLVYGEAPTRWVSEARERGLVALDGREVLLHQAAPQFRAMTGRELPLAAARRAIGLPEEER